MLKALADRLAEAFRRAHAQASAQLNSGAYAALTRNSPMTNSYVKPIKAYVPAPGYPANPDHTEKLTLWRLLDVETRTGIKLTENLAMYPTASVSGLYFRPSRKPIFRPRQNHQRSGRKLRRTQRLYPSGDGALAKFESGLLEIWIKLKLVLRPTCTACRATSARLLCWLTL